jgi:hypothetical protein
MNTVWDQTAHRCDRRLRHAGVTALRTGILWPR